MFSNNTIDLMGLTGNKITTNLNQYPIILMSQTGIGKTTSMKQILESLTDDERVPLFLAFEDRFQNIPGIMAIRVRSVADLQTIIAQLKNPELKKKFSAVVIDTLDKCSDLISKYVADSKGTAIVGDIGYGKGGQYVKSVGSFVDEIKNEGYLLCYCVQADVSKDFSTGAEIIAPKVDKELWKTAYTDAYLCGMLEANLITGDRTLTFKKTTKFTHLKDTLGMPNKIKVSDFKVELRKAIEKTAGGQLTDEDTITRKVVDNRDFDKLKAEGMSLGEKIVAKGHGQECSMVLTKVIGFDDNNNPVRFSSLVPSQIDLVEMAVLALRKLAEEKGIK